MCNREAFTLIEVLVSMAVLTFVASLILVNYPSLNESVGLTRGAQSIASAVRRAQVYGIAVKQYLGGEFPAYGIHFDIPQSDINYKLFADIFPYPGGNYNYDEGEGELVDTYSIPHPNYLSDLCVGTEAENPDCVPSCGFESLDIIFERPNPEVFLYAFGAVQGNVGPCKQAKIVLRSPQGREKSVLIWKSGQIQVPRQ